MDKNCNDCISNHYCNFKDIEDCSYYVQRSLPNRLCNLCQNLVCNSEFYIDCKEFGRGFNNSIEHCKKFKLKV